MNKGVPPSGSGSRPTDGAGQSSLPVSTADAASIPNAISFNVNEYVHVRLTSRGRDILRAKNSQWQAMFPDATWPMPKEDANGWSRWQLWDLMAHFGEHIVMGLPVPFETTIEIVLPAASGIAARSDETRSGSAEGKSPVGEAETPNPSPPPPTEEHMK